MERLRRATSHSSPTVKPKQCRAHCALRVGEGFSLCVSTRYLTAAPHTPAALSRCRASVRGGSTRRCPGSEGSAHSIQVCWPSSWACGLTWCLEQQEARQSASLHCESSGVRRRMQHQTRHVVLHSSLPALGSFRKRALAALVQERCLCLDCLGCCCTLHQSLSDMHAFRRKEPTPWMHQTAIPFDHR